MPDKIYGYSETETEKKRTEISRDLFNPTTCKCSKKKKQLERNFFFKEMATVFLEQNMRFTFCRRSEKTGIYVHWCLFSRTVSVKVKKAKRNEAKVLREDR
ncbi:hypothetical protein CDAR_64021 [Caerostris darwini]|uniref:Uncharacterized protein n=1 Tax=Caerostris darwini TaxID=1538125 RepID=A0AAV4PL43_9ARAC|nr:hypothetical protein CDAR_64021 [Caerostris darwini]